MFKGRGGVGAKKNLTWEGKDREALFWLGEEFINLLISILNLQKECSGGGEGVVGAKGTYPGRERIEEFRGKGVAGAKTTHPGRGRMEKLYPDWGRSFHCYQRGNLTCAAPANHRLFCHCLWFPVQLRTLQELAVDWIVSCSWQRNCGTDSRSCFLTPQPWLGSPFHTVWPLLKCK